MIDALTAALNDGLAALQAAITQETVDRIAVDAYLQTQIDSIELIPGLQGGVDLVNSDLDGCLMMQKL